MGVGSGDPAQHAVADVPDASSVVATGPVPVTPIIIPAQDNPVSMVVVFGDRAEVTRSVLLDELAPGRYAVSIPRLTQYIDSESVRVKGSGTAAITILEVSFSAHWELPSEAGAGERATDESKAKTLALQSELEAVKRQVHQREQRVAALEAAQALLDQFTESALSGGASGVPPLDLAVLEATLRQNATKSVELSGQRRGQEVELRGLREQESKLTGQLAELAASASAPPSWLTRCVTILVDVTEGGTACLNVSYLVSHVAWTPSYDVRVTSLTSKLTITYFGKIVQSSEEDWKDCRLVLSTAQPSVGGTAPTPPSRHVSVVHLHRYYRVSRKKGGFGGGCGGTAVANESSYFEPEARNCRDDYGGDEEEDDDCQGEVLKSKDVSHFGSLSRARRAMKVAGSTVAQTGANATFTIDRLATIESDNKPHKVTIASFTLDATFSHYSPVCKSQSAFLFATCTNATEYIMLPGPASVFTDGSFTATTSLPRVSPLEAFSSSLGVDASVKIEYRNMGRVKATSGVLAREDVTTQRFLISIKNSRSTPTTLVLADTLPKSDHSSLKVKLIAPDPELVLAGTEAVGDLATTSDTVVDASAGSGVVEVVIGTRKAAAVAGAGGAGAPGDGTAPKLGATWLNKVSNNIYWRLTLAPQETCSIPFDYSVTVPQGRPFHIRG